MAHEVTLNLNSKFVLNKDIEIEVKTDAGKLGTLLVSKGNVEWKPAGNSRNKKRLTWTKFAALLESEGKAVKAPSPAARAAKKKADADFGEFAEFAEPERSPAWPFPATQTVQKSAKKPARKSSKV